ncbi:Acetyltransferase (isoleucine patch superfamily) [Neorhodopirellula lusitana]|uniref:Acetyltransferase (Isoleucine patch superfamily) n=1 Tax=Neorhodopirellula lusitana TaxID=445327 RepID=A0ABY1QDS7_9BACT|nr:acyltransferase [Neorhodopirellula lusitana]SMP68569.1 Acetyltransferase (isoleucine patch superfamily) [Neorhodopirellula lusitana]
MIHDQALVDDLSVLGEGTDVWAYAHIMKGVQIGKRCSFGDHAFVESGAVIGNNVTVKNQVLIWEGITIEDDVFVGPRVTFTNDVFPRSPRGKSAAERYDLKSSWLVSTTVGQGASIGAGAIICPGANLGRYCMVAAGSVVTKDVPDFALVMGNPARHVGDVCSCGSKLDGPASQSTCQHCGQTPEQRNL